MFAGWAQDAEVARYVLWTPHRTLDDTRAFVARYALEGRGVTHCSWITVRAADDVPIGTIGLRLRPPRSEVGFNLARGVWGRGYGTEALAAVVAFGLSLPDVCRVHACCHPENRASARIMEKVGMVREGLLRRHTVFPNLGPEARDVLLYAKTQ